MLLNDLDIPIVLAPLAGGPSTPELAAAVAEAGGLGFLAAGYLTAEELERRMARLRELAPGRPVAVNLFVPGADRGPVEVRFLERLTAWAAERGIELGEARWSDDDWEAKLELLRREPVAAVSFTFGCPPPELLAELQACGSEVWVTVTNPAEAATATERGAQVLVAQGAEAGGHRGAFEDGGEDVPIGLLALLALVRRASPLPVVASGGIATGEGIAAVLAAGAAAAQLGSAFLLTPEAGTPAPHRERLRRAGSTVLTRAFTGRLARGIRNRFTDAFSAGAPVAYPQLHYVTAPMRRRARTEGDGELINLWAGQAYELALELPAAELAWQLAAEADAALRAAARRRGISA
jgi:nitronate monooxygenase